MFDEYFKFAFVRNPWNRMVSIYKYFEYDKISSFKSFLTGEFRNNLFKNKHWFVGPQSDYVYSEDGELLVDYVGRFEDLQNDFNHICKQIGLPPTKLPHVNASKNKRSILSKNPKSMLRNILYTLKIKKPPYYKNYRKYYDKESIDLVAEFYQKDIELFGYDFE